jgi:hypothetical protein
MRSVRQQLENVAIGGKQAGTLSAQLRSTPKRQKGIAPMKLALPASLVAAAALLGGAYATPALADTPDATVHFGQTTVAFIGSIQWGGGTLHYNGHDIGLKVSGLGVGSVGANHLSADGEVYNLHHASDIYGTYAAINANATAGSGAGEIDMRNEHGVEIRAHATSSGLSLSLAPTGVVIQPR